MSPLDVGGLTFQDLAITFAAVAICFLMATAAGGGPRAR